MTTEGRDLVAVPDTACASDEAAIKQLAVMFSRIAIAPPSIMNNNFFESPETKKTRAWLVGTGILFEVDLRKLGSLSTDDARNAVEVMRNGTKIDPQGLQNFIFRIYTICILRSASEKVRVS